MHEIQLNPFRSNNSNDDPPKFLPIILFSSTVSDCRGGGGGSDSLSFESSSQRNIDESNISKKQIECLTLLLSSNPPSTGRSSGRGVAKPQVVDDDDGDVDSELSLDVSIKENEIFNTPSQPPPLKTTPTPTIITSKDLQVIYYLTNGDGNGRRCYASLSTYNYPLKLALKAMEELEGITLRIGDHGIKQWNHNNSRVGDILRRFNDEKVVHEDCMIKKTEEKIEIVRIIM